MVQVPIVRLDPDLPVPSYAHAGDAGADLYAGRRRPSRRAADGRSCRPASRIAIPEGYAGFVLPRSGLALRHGITCLNTPGLIDAGYRDEVRVILVNTDPHEPYTVQRGDRIAQLVVQRIEESQFIAVDGHGDCPASDRGLGGFGSTGHIAPSVPTGIGDGLHSEMLSESLGWWS